MELITESKIGNKYEYWSYIKRTLENNGFLVHPWKEINYGLQFHVEKKVLKDFLEYLTAKRIKARCSQIKDKNFKGL